MLKLLLFKSKEKPDVVLSFALWLILIVSVMALLQILVLVTVYIRLTNSF
jgi:hypothetical protein